jgi:SpoVK/Ycf46/Vps4 family AAA+-type ATPase
MQCTSCKKENRSIAKFCKQCGTNIESAAPAVSLGISIDELLGLDDLKKELQELHSIFEGMKQHGVKSHYPYNTILIGPSGTAKTLISKLIAELFLEFGMITKSKPLVLDGEAIESLNEEKGTLKKVFEDAKGGIIFIDNAQKLVDGEGNASAGFQRFVNKMDQYKEESIVIMAGLPYGLREFAKNPKFKNITGRFQKIFTINDYTPSQYVSITEFELKKQGFIVNEEVSAKLLKRFRYLYKELKKADTTVSAINGYLAMNEARSIVGSYFSRKGSDKQIHVDDIKDKVDEKKSLEQVMADLENIIGMTDIKKEIKGLFEQLKQITEMEKRGIKGSKPALHFVITGNPGTGKTTVARLLGEIFEGMGLLEAGHVVEVDRSKLVAGYIGQTAPLTNKACDDALGGILFIDEAYDLARNDKDEFGLESVVTLLKRMEDDRGKFMVVIAGYKKPIEQFLTANDGLKSRFTNYFDLADYNQEELAQIYVAIAEANHFIVPMETKERVVAYFKDRVARKTKDFANGREARNLFDASKRNQSERKKTLDVATMTNDDIMTLMPEDIPVPASEKGVSLEVAIKELNELVGLGSVKDAVKKISDTLEMQKIKGKLAS